MVILITWMADVDLSINGFVRLICGDYDVFYGTIAANISY